MPVNFAFAGQPGLKVRLHDGMTELDFLKLFLTDAIIDDIVKETQLYADELYEHANRQRAAIPNARMLSWDGIDANRMWRFLALCFTTGIVRKPNVPMYWSTKDTISTPFFSKTMSFNVFNMCMTALHFNHGENVSNDRLWKVRPFYDAITGLFSSVYAPTQNICIDESLTLYKGRLSFKQYNRSKRARFGLKSYELCESESGYCYRFSLYTGKDVDELGHSEHGVGYGVVMKLMEGLDHLGYRLAIDNWYSSPQLMSDLAKKRTHCFGTAKLTRKGMPVDLHLRPDGSDLKKGEVSCFSSSDLIALCWKDQSLVTMLSNCHSGAMSDKVVKVRGGVEVTKPKVVMDYNEIMGGVDLKDQMVKYYSYFRKSVKWYRRLVFTLLEVSVYNAYVLWRQHTNRQGRINFLDYRISVISQILQAVGCDASAGPLHGVPRNLPVAGENALRLAGRHFPSLNPPSRDGRKPASFRKCLVCNQTSGARPVKGETRLRKETKFQCIPCGNIPLCPAPCFERYHTLVNF